MNTVISGYLFPVLMCHNFLAFLDTCLNTFMFISVTWNSIPLSKDENDFHQFSSALQLLSIADKKWIIVGNVRSLHRCFLNNFPTAWNFFQKIFLDDL